MTNDDISDQISNLEDRIEMLAQTIENCRRIILISKGAIISGILWALGAAGGVLGSGPLPILVAISLVIFGIVSFGSNWSTLKQNLAALKETEARRTELIGSIDLQTVTTREALGHTRP